MNYRDRHAAQSDDDDLSSFVSESAIDAPSLVAEPTDPLWDFPQEALPSAPAAAADVPLAAADVPLAAADVPLAAADVPPAAASVPPGRTLSDYASYVSLAAAILLAAVAGAWWGESIPGNRPVATAAAAPPTAITTAIAPAIEPRPEAESQPPAQLRASMELRPSARPPLATIVPSIAREDTARIASPPPKVVALSAAPERRQPLERPSSIVRGTSGGARTVPPPGPRPSTEPVTTAPMAAVATPAVRSALPEPPAAPEPSPAPVSPPRAAAAIVRPEPEALPSVVARTEQSEIQRTLGQYRSAYSLLDAEAARAVWPSVDVRALARAFDSLTSQELAFETCQFDIVGQAATAQCRGSATYTPKVGSRGPKLEPRQWTFQLRKVDEGWKIQSAQTRR